MIQSRAQLAARVNPQYSKRAGRALATQHPAHTAEGLPPHEVKSCSQLPYCAGNHFRVVQFLAESSFAHKRARSLRR